MAHISCTLVTHSLVLHALHQHVILQAKPAPRPAAKPKPMPPPTVTPLEMTSQEAGSLLRTLTGRMIDCSHEPVQLLRSTLLARLAALVRTATVSEGLDVHVTLPWQVVSCACRVLLLGFWALHVAKQPLLLAEKSSAASTQQAQGTSYKLTCWLNAASLLQAAPGILHHLCC